MTDSVMPFPVAAVSATIPRKLPSLPVSIRSTLLSRAAGLVFLPLGISLLIPPGLADCFALLFVDEGAEISENSSKVGIAAGGVAGWAIPDVPTCSVI